MEITEENSGINILKSKSTRDQHLSDKIPDNCGLCKNSATYYVIGKPGSGKSHLMEHIMKTKPEKGGFKNCYDAVFLICPRTSRSGYKKSYSKQMNPTRIYEDLNVENLEKINEEIGEVNDESDNDPRFSALIIDDCASDLRNKNTNRLLLKMIQNHRHKNLSIYIVVQNLMMASKNIRDNMSCLLQFKTGSLKEIKTLNDEFVPHLKINECLDLLDYIYKDKYSFLLVNRRDDYICKSFNRLKIKTGRGGEY